MTSSPRDPEASYAQEVTPRPTNNPKHSSQELSKIPVLQDKPKRDPLTSVSFGDLYRYASPTDLLCLVLGLLAAAAGGALAPCTALVFGDAVASFQRTDEGVDSHAINKAALEYVVLAGLLFLADYLALVLLMHSAERQMSALRLATLRHMLFMDMSWFDAQATSALSSRLTGDRPAELLLRYTRSSRPTQLWMPRAWTESPPTLVSVASRLWTFSSRTLHVRTQLFSADTMSLSSLARPSRLSAPAERARVHWLLCWSGSTVRSEARSCSMATTSARSTPRGCVRRSDSSHRSLCSSPGRSSRTSLLEASARPRENKSCRRPKWLAPTTSSWRCRSSMTRSWARKALSGGQKQRVAIARAIVRDPKILILDEATSALDAESERTVQDALNRLLATTQRTTVVIAHRLSTIRRADKIVVLSGGRVAEEGSHSDLLGIEDGLYRKLYTIQGETMGKGNVKTAETETSVVSTVRDHAVSARPSVSEIPASTEAAPDQPPTFTVPDALRLPRRDLQYFALAVVAIAISAFALPGSSLLISAMANSLALQFAKYEAFQDRSYLDTLADDVTLYGVCYAAGSFAVFLTTATHTYCFGLTSERLLARLRSRHFAALCRQDIGFFDSPDHATGALTTDLSTHATKVAAITGSVFGGVVDAVWTFLAALLISFLLGSWKLSLVMLAIVPLLMVAGAVRSNHLRAQRGQADELAAVGAHASEALTWIRTVASFGLENQVTERFNQLLREPLRQGRTGAQINGLAIGFASFVVYAAQGLAFWYGGRLVERRENSFLELMRSLMAIMMAVNGIGYVLTFLGDAEKARQAGGEIVSICSRPFVIDSLDEQGVQPTTVEGKIEFQNISFRYPSRPAVQVLENYNLTIDAGETVAFCGPSGGSKSTCLALLERFYDPDAGVVSLDGHDLRQLNVHWLRRQIGLVGQEPTLFTGSIAENIAYGCEHEPSQEQIEAAAKAANAHGFITQFPDGYATQVGATGEQLSGGQKQRIAIARAVLKNPTILLLDEATSALDTESEAVVQAALDNVVRLRRRTTLIIAHRLSTIRSADRICVVSGGAIAEQGTHDELLARGGVYTKLAEAAST